MHRYGVRDDQDNRPGREGHVGGTAEDNRSLRYSVVIEPAVPGVICRHVSTIQYKATFVRSRRAR